MTQESSTSVSKWAKTTHEKFWHIVDLIHDDDGTWQHQKEINAACYGLAKYLIAHVGYFRLADSIQYLARSVAKESHD